jgi:hypothetical protein
MAVEVRTAEYVLTEYVFEQPVSVPDYWQFSDAELARSCVLVAESLSGPRNAPVRGEAMRLFLLWREAINGSGKREVSKQGAMMLWRLSKRRMKIRVWKSVQVLIFTP